MRRTSFLLVWISVVCANLNAQSISNLSVKEIVPLEHSEDNLFVKETISMRDMVIISYKRNHEYFTPSDTNRRDYISLEGKTFILDSLIGEFVSNYTMSFSALEAYLFKKNYSEYLILYGGDTFFNMNGNDPPNYIIFYNNGGGWIFYKTYYFSTDESPTKVKFRCKRNKVSLKGRNLVTAN
jgi:hypothetical protein